MANVTSINWFCFTSFQDFFYGLLEIREDVLVCRSFVFIFITTERVFYVEDFVYLLGGLLCPEAPFNRGQFVYVCFIIYALFPPFDEKIICYFV